MLACRVLRRIFPGLHIVLLDSDCVPVTLFEVEDLWQEAQRLQHSGFPGPVPTSSCAGGLNLDQKDLASTPKPKQQGVILVTEHNAEVNAGIIVVRGSNHAPPLLETDWQSIPLCPGDSQNQAIGKYGQKLVATYWQIVYDMVSHGRDDRDMTPTECRAWIQTGLALTPFCGHIMNTSLEWTVAWSLVGEWTTRTLFPPPKGEWPRQGHPRALVTPYDQRSVPLLTWARACFEQGSLPSLLALSGKASLMVLPGDGMFQAQRVVSGRCRPVILHGYGGAKKEMPASLATLAKSGWIPMAMAMVGSATSPPLWAGNDWRPILGTSVDTKLLPPSLSAKECLLLLSLWTRIPCDDLHIMHATNSWPKPNKVNIALGPDCDDSPHSIRVAPLDLGIAPYFEVLFGPQTNDKDHQDKEVKPEESHVPDATQEENNKLPSLEEVLLILRVQVDSCGPADLTALTSILLGGTSATCHHHLLWIQAVQDYFDDVPLIVSCRKLLQLVCDTALQVGVTTSLVGADGSHQSGDLGALCSGSAPFPSGGVHVLVRAKNALTSCPSPDDPQLVNIDCTGLGGHDLGGCNDYDICIRTDKHGQSIYGPSVTPVEAPGRDGTHQVSLVALGGSKAMHEFLILHYMATNSAEEWDIFLDLCLPPGTWVRAGSRRALAMHMYDKCHVAPSHRRFANSSWIAGMKLMLDLLLGARQNRYLRSRPFEFRPAEVYVRGFSAGSYSGICLLHLLWNMPHIQVGGILGGIALPPALLHGIRPDHGDRLMVIHLTTDRLCQWHPHDDTLHSLRCKYCIVDRSTMELREHFGACEHSYGHWIDLNMPHGRFPLWQLMRQYPEVAHPQSRDIAPLSLVSWVSCEVPARVQQVLNQLMILFRAVTPVASDEVLEIGRQQLKGWDMIRDALIRELIIGGNTCPSEEVCRLMASFLQRLPLPRLVHFLDMILPQMVPVQSPCHSRRRRFASSYRVEERLADGEQRVEYHLNVLKLFWSRSDIMHVAIAWDSKPLLLLTTALLPDRTTESFRMEAGPPYDKQRIQMGLRKGNTVLIYFRSGVGHYQCVMIALSSDLCTNKPWQGQHKFWKYVSPIRTYFAWLPEQLARTYCSAALDMCPRLPYGGVHHLQGRETDFQHSMFFQNIYHIGDAKSAQELEGFLRMPRERLRLCCGILCTDSLLPNGPLQRRKLFTAAIKLLRFAIGIETVCGENEEQKALRTALLPLLRLEDGHVLATLSAIVLALCEGRTGLAISGMFEAGKTRSAAALLAGLLVFDPSLQLMVLTKENVAAHAVAEHLVSLQLPDHIQGKMGRLVGYYEQNRKGSYTPLGILPSNRNQVIRQKSLLIGCGGAFQQECSQQFSPVADWMGSVDLL